MKRRLVVSLTAVFATIVLALLGAWYWNSTRLSAPDNAEASQNGYQDSRPTAGSTRVRPSRNESLGNRSSPHLLRADKAWQRWTSHRKCRS